uniref:Uncharacterized protein n=1 Tax=Steinernema glaseri TaxID=37863 RepID=A0A1I7Y5V1_9BILA
MFSWEKKKERKLGKIVKVTHWEETQQEFLCSPPVSLAAGGAHSRSPNCHKSARRRHSRIGPESAGYRQIAASPMCAPASTTCGASTFPSAQLDLLVRSLRVINCRSSASRNTLPADTNLTDAFC